MSEQASPRNRIWIIALIVSLLVLSIPMAIGSGGGGGLVQLGQWNNFPCGQPDCSISPPGYAGGIACSVGPLSNITISGGAGDQCQLFNSAAYWTVIPTPGAGLVVNLEVNCVSPATPTTSGSVIQLQYANYSRTSTLWENSTNFVLVPNFQAIYIDNTLGWDCPGTLVSTSSVAIPSSAAPGNAYVFRAVGVCGCDSTTKNGGNPILSTISLQVQQGFRRIFTPVLVTHTTTAFSFQMVTNIAVTTTTTVNVSWLSTNQTTTACGVADMCIQSGTTSCSITVGNSNCSSTTLTYPTAFTGTVEVELTTLTSVGGNVVINIGTYVMFATHVTQA